MNSEPLILVLEDERPQILTLRATLEPLGRVADFSDPERALEYIETQQVDAAIVDIHMPEMPINGIEFIRAVRKFDKDLSVIIRTGDASVELADEAIEVQAYRRAIKSKTSVQELRDLARLAILETRSRRKLTRDAGSAAEMSEQLERTLGSTEDEMSVAEAYKGLIHSIRNQLTAVAGFGEVWSTLAKHANDRTSLETAGENKRVVDRMLADMTEFLDGPFAETQTIALRNARADVNATLEALKRKFAATSVWAAERKSVEISQLKQSLVVSAHPLKLLTALRHAVEFCLGIATPNAHVALEPAYVLDLERYIELSRAPNLVFNRPARKNEIGYVCFALNVSKTRVSLEQVHERFHSYPEDLRVGNLHMLSLALGEDRCTVLVCVDPSGALSFCLSIPVAK